VAGGWWDAELFGPPHREADLAVLESLHEGLRRLRLVRRRGRRLLATVRGRELAAAPGALLQVLSADLGAGDAFTESVAVAVVGALDAAESCDWRELDGAAGARVRRQGLIGRGRELEGALLRALAPLADDPRVAEVRGGTGLMAAAELSPDVLAERPGAVAAWQAATREAGVLARNLAKGLAVSPPLIITEPEIQDMADAMRAGLDAL
jgi:hypothetical protein